RVGFIGLCSMEYKRDRRDGQWYMGEPTVSRTDYQEEVATLNGGNIPYAAYLGELEQEPPPRAKRPAFAWRDPIADALAGETGAPRGTGSLPAQGAYWRPDDPGPYVALRLNGFRERVARLIRPTGSRSPA